MGIANLLNRVLHKFSLLSFYLLNLKSKTVVSAVNVSEKHSGNETEK